MFPDHVVPTSATRTPTARKARHAGPRRSARSKQARPRLVGLTAAVAAATSAVSLTGSAAPRTTPTAAPIDGQNITAARIDRRLLASRDATRIGLAQTTARARQAEAAKLATARAAKLTQYRQQMLRRAQALAAAKVAAAKAEAAERAQGARMMISGYHITATFNQAGSRWSRNHTGLDFAAPIGTRIGSVMAGEVISAEFAGAYGRRVEVRHDDGTVTWYCHMSEFTVSVGDRIAAGDQVGSVGVTGNTTGPHLHFEVHPGGGDAVDPYPWLQDHGLNP